MWGVGLATIGTALTLLPLRLAVVAVVVATAIALSIIRPVVALCLLCFAIPFGSLFQVEVAGLRIGVTEGLLALTLAGWMARSVALREGRWKWPRLSVPLLIFIGVAALSLVGANSLPSACKELAKWIEFLGLMLFVGNALSRVEGMAVVTSALLAGMAQAALGAYQFLTRSGPEFFVLMGRFMRAYGTFEQPNPYAGYLGMLVPLAVALALSLLGSRFWFGRGQSASLASPTLSSVEKCSAGQNVVPTWLAWTALLGAAMMLAAIGMSWSRGAWMGVGSALLVVIPARSRRRTGALAALAALVIIAALALALGLWAPPQALAQRLNSMLSFLHLRDVRQVEVTDENYAAVERLAHWQAALAMWRDHLWLGVGFGNYGTAYADYALPKWPLPLGHAHNYYLNVAAETGFLGLIAYLGAWGAALWQTSLALRRARGDYTHALALGALGMLIHVSAHNLVDNLWVHGLYLQAAILLGLLERDSRPSAVSPLSVGSRNRRRINRAAWQNPSRPRHLRGNPLIRNANLIEGDHPIVKLH